MRFFEACNRRLCGSWRENQLKADRAGEARAARNLVSRSIKISINLRDNASCRRKPVQQNRRFCQSKIDASVKIDASDRTRK
jgi:hypothetical protein